MHSCQICYRIEHGTLDVYGLELGCNFDKILQVFKFQLCNGVNNIDAGVVIGALLHLLSFRFDVCEGSDSGIATLYVFTHIEVPSVTL